MQCSPYFIKYFETLYGMNDCFDRLIQRYYNRTGIFQTDCSITYRLAFSPDCSCYLTIMLKGLYTGKILAPNLTSHTIMALLSRTSLIVKFLTIRIFLRNPIWLIGFRVMSSFVQVHRHLSEPAEAARWRGKMTSHRHVVLKI